LGDEYKPGYQKTAETLQLANQWEGSNPPIPVAPSQAVPQQQILVQQPSDNAQVMVRDFT